MYFKVETQQLLAVFLLHYKASFLQESRIFPLLLLCLCMAKWQLSSIRRSCGCFARQRLPWLICQEFIYLSDIHIHYYPISQGAKLPSACYKGSTTAGIRVPPHPLVPKGPGKRISERTYIRNKRALSTQQYVSPAVALQDLPFRPSKLLDNIMRHCLARAPELQHSLFCPF